MPINALLNVDVPPINVDVLPNLLRAAVAHVERHIEDDQEADIGDPAVLLQQARNKAGGEAHQRNGEPQTEYQDERMLAGRTRDRQHELGLEPAAFAKHLLLYYEPELHRLLFGAKK